MVHFSKKAFFLSLFLCILSVFLYAEIPAGVLLTYTKPIIDYNNIKIENENNEDVPPFSGLRLYSGDRVRSLSEEVIVVVPTNSLIVKVAPYTDIALQVENLGGREYLIKIIASSGLLELEVHKGNDIMQILQNISQPLDIPRNDKSSSPLISDATIYVQIIDENVEIISRNVGYDSNVFVTGTDFDIYTFIDNLRDNSVKRTEIMDLLAIPTETRKGTFSQQFAFTTYLQNFTGVQNFTGIQYVNGIYKMKIQKEKFFISLQMPLFFPRNGFLYNPLGENDLLFGSNIREDEYKTLSTTKKIGLVASHAVMDTLKKIETLSYGTEADSFYLYYGEQKEWHNPRSTMFAYHYSTFTSTPNNFNQDFKMKFNGKKIGNELRARQFQPTSFTTPLYQSFDIVYDRLWWQPVNPLSTFEIGITGAADFSVGNTNLKDKNDFIQGSVLKSTSYMMLFAGVDITIPIVNAKRYTLDFTTEGGMLFPYSSLSKRISAKTNNTNFGIKAGITQNFLNFDKNIKTGFITNFYYTRGIFKPHYAVGGYEYTNRFQYTRGIAAMEYEKNYALTTTQSIFLNYYLFPEIEYFFHANNFNFSFGGYYVIDRNAKQVQGLTTTSPITAESLEQTSVVFVSIDGNINSWIPNKKLQVSFAGKYTAGNIPINFEIEPRFVIFANSMKLDRNVLDAKITFEFDKRIGISGGYFTSPQYDEGNTLILHEDRSPLLGQFPYLSLYINIIKQ